MTGPLAFWHKALGSRGGLSGMRFANALVVSWVVLLAVAAVPARGAEPVAEPESADAPAGADAGSAVPELEVRLRVSGWAAAWGGDVDARGARTDVTAQLGEAFELENLGASAELELRWRRLVVVAGGSWLDVDDELETEPLRVGFLPTVLDATLFFPGAPPGAFGVAIPGTTATIAPGRVDVDVEQATGELLLGYRLVSAPLPRLAGGSGGADSRRVDFDVVAGVRYYDVETRIDVSIPPAEFAGVVGTVFFIPAPELFPELQIDIPPEFFESLRGLELGELEFGEADIPNVLLAGVRRRFEADARWLDPVLGFRLGVDLADCLRLRLRGDVGGFGLGSASRLSWTAELGLVLRLTAHWEAELAWLASGLERDRGAGALDILVHGPRAGVTYRF